MIFAAFFKALAQTGDPRFRRVLWFGIGLTIVVLIAVTTAFLLFLGWFVGDSTNIPLLGEVRWLDDVVNWAGLGVMIVLSIILMVPVASAITSMFLDTVAQAVEDKHYPNLPTVPGVPVMDAVRDTVNFLGIIIAVNFVAMFLYAFFAPLALFIFWGVNGYLLGMEYFQLAAMRRLGRAKAREMRKRHRGTIWAAGVLMAMPLTVPIVNLVIPILGAATFTHIFHTLNARNT